MESNGAMPASGEDVETQETMAEGIVNPTSSGERSVHICSDGIEEMLEEASKLGIDRALELFGKGFRDVGFVIRGDRAGLFSWAAREKSAKMPKEDFDCFKRRILDEDEAKSALMRTAAYIKGCSGKGCRDLRTEELINLIVLAEEWIEDSGKWEYLAEYVLGYVNLVERQREADEKEASGHWKPESYQGWKFQQVYDLLHNHYFGSGKSWNRLLQDLDRMKDILVKVSEVVEDEQYNWEKKARIERVIESRIVYLVGENLEKCIDKKMCFLESERKGSDSGDGGPENKPEEGKGEAELKLRTLKSISKLFTRRKEVESVDERENKERLETYFRNIEEKIETLEGLPPLKPLAEGTEEKPQEAFSGSEGGGPRTRSCIFTSIKGLRRLRQTRATKSPAKGSTEKSDEEAVKELTNGMAERAATNETDGVIQFLMKNGGIFRKTKNGRVFFNCQICGRRRAKNGPTAIVLGCGHAFHFYCFLRCSANSLLNSKTACTKNCFAKEGCDIARVIENYVHFDERWDPSS
jgi:hypothetical protein